MTHVFFPYRVDGHGRTAGAAPAEHLRHLIEQVIFERPGSRLNRPDFGCGLDDLVFAENGEALRTTVELMVQGALQRWLGDRLAARSVEVESIEEKLRITVRYALPDDPTEQEAVFERSQPS